jgi:multiple sugar transport system ATP-binding protein
VPVALQGGPVTTVRFDHVDKVFAGGVHAVKSVELEIRDGEFMVFVGPSGCGKTTLLRLLGGLEEVDRGNILLDGQDITDTPPQRRDIAMVFQNYALYPHKTVRDNLAFGLKMRGTPKAEIAQRVASVASSLGLEELLDRKPAALSGGQRQRVAMGRAIAREPKVFLMDEPLSNLDAKLRVLMRAEIARLHARLGVTTVYVTHDQVEAMTLGHRVAVFREGELQQCASPKELYEHPANLFVAAFIGSPSMNLVTVDIADGQVSFSNVRLPLPEGHALAEARGRYALGVRPSDLRRAPDQAPEHSTLSGTIDAIEDLGSEVLVHFGVDAERVVTDAVTAAQDQEGDYALIVDDAATRFAARLDGGDPVAIGDTVRLTLPLDRLYLFELATGHARGRVGLVEPPDAPTVEDAAATAPAEA